MGLLTNKPTDANCPTDAMVLYCRPQGGALGRLPQVLQPGPGQARCGPCCLFVHDHAGSMACLDTAMHGLGPLPWACNGAPVADPCACASNRLWPTAGLVEKRRKVYCDVLRQYLPLSKDTTKRLAATSSSSSAGAGAGAAAQPETKKDL